MKLMGLLSFIFGYKKKSKVYVDDKGYFRFKDSGKLVHRWVDEKKLGRKLRAGEVVHHINRNKRDNSPEQNSNQQTIFTTCLISQPLSCP